MMFSISKWQRLSWQDINRTLAVTYLRLQLFANSIGIGICFLYFIFFEEVKPRSLESENNILGPVLISVALIVLGGVASHRWLADIRLFVRHQVENIPVSDNLREKSRRKIVNLPLASSIISFVNWSIATFAVPFFVSIETNQHIIGLEVGSYWWVAIGIAVAGIVTSIMVFFLTELMCRPIWEVFFPTGELIRTKGVFRVNLWQRILIIFLMATIFPLADMALVSYQKAQMMITGDPVEVLNSLLILIVFVLIVELSLVIVLSTFMSRSIVAPVLNLKSAMSKVAKGNFEARAKVVDNNELGVLANHFNEMTKGLKERYELLKTLAVAKEVQQNLLPEHIPDAKGLDIAGQNLYCDQTGGDYYDFIKIRGEQKKIVAAVGDVSGHGIPSALLMASARAFLRQRFALPGSLDQIVNDVNAQFCQDVGHSGRFMTLFLAVVDPGNQLMQWVRAGHDPALLYHPESDSFKELKTGGIPLGVDETFDYTDCVTLNETFETSQILFVGTDGIWESCNRDGEMFGKDRVKSVLRKCCRMGATDIVANLLEELQSFMAGRSFSDDVTLIVIKRTSGQ